MKKLITFALCAILVFEPLGIACASETNTEIQSDETNSEASETKPEIEGTALQKVETQLYNQEQGNEDKSAKELEEIESGQEESFLENPTESKSDGEEAVEKEAITEGTTQETTIEEANVKETIGEEAVEKEAITEGTTQETTIEEANVKETIEGEPTEEQIDTEEENFKTAVNYEIVDSHTGKYIKILGLREGTGHVSELVIPEGLKTELPEDETKLSESEDDIETESSENSQDDTKTTLIPIKTIEEKAFSGNTELIRIIIKADLDYIGDEAFRECKQLETVDMDNAEKAGKIRKIGKSAFSECENLYRIDLHEVMEIGEYAFDKCISMETANADSIEKIADHTFDGCIELRNVSFVNAKEFGIGALRGCESIRTLECENAKKIGNAAFSGCKSLYSIRMQAVTVVGMEAFKDCFGLGTAEFSDEVASIGTGVFAGCSNLSALKMKTNIRNIPNNFASGCRYLNTVEFLDSVDNIGNYAFEGCSSLDSDFITGLVKNAKSIGVHAFDGCAELTAVDIPASIVNINDYAFANCTRLGAVTINEGILRINEGAFKGCTALAQLHLPQSLVKLGDEALSDCTQLAQINIPAGLEKVGMYVFENDRQLTAVTISGGLKTIPAYLFYGSSIKLVDIPETVEKIDVWAFCENENLEGVRIPNKTIEFASDDIFPDNGKVTLYGYIGSTTEEYAVKNNLKFQTYAEVDTNEISLNTQQAELVVDDTLQLEVSYLPNDATRYHTAVFASADTEIASVDEYGRVKALMPGTATITAKTENGLTAVCDIKVTMPSKPEGLAAVTNVDKRLKDVSLKDSPKWSFEQPETRLYAVSGSSGKEYAAVYTNDNNDQIKDSLAVDVTTIQNVRIEGDSKISLSGKDSMRMTVVIDSIGAKLPENRYKLTWSWENGNINIIDNKDGTATITGAKTGKDNLVLELYVLDANARYVQKEEGVNYFKVVKEIEVVDASVIRGLYFSQSGLQESMLEINEMQGITSITMLPENKVNQFRISANAYCFEDGKESYVNKKIKYSVSNKKIAKVTANKDGSALVTVLDNGIVNITATVTDSNYTQSVKLAIVDYMPRLSEETVTMNLYKQVSNADISIYPSYNDYYQCSIIEDGIEVVYLDSSGKRTDSEFVIVKNEEANGYTVSVRDGAELRKGKKKVFLAVTVRGSAGIGSQTHYLPLTVRLVEQKPKVTYEKEPINPFYKESKGKLTIVSPDADIEDVTFTSSAKGKAGLDAAAIPGKVNELAVIPNAALSRKYTKKYAVSGTLQVKFAGYKDSADVVVKNFKLAADNTLPDIISKNKEICIYPELSDTTAVKLFGEDKSVLPNDYEVSWKDTKDKNRELFSVKTDKTNGLLKITALKGKSGKVALTVKSSKWNMPVDIVYNVKVVASLRIRLSANTITLNKGAGTSQTVPVGLSVVGNDSLSITNLQLVSTKNKDDDLLKNISVTYDESLKQALFSLGSNVKQIKDMSGKYRLTATIEEDGKTVEASTDINIKLSVKNAKVSTKVTNGINLLRRENTYAVCSAKLENISGNIESVKLRGEYAGYFRAELIKKGKNKGKIFIYARPVREYAYFSSNVEYNLSIECRADNGCVYTSDEFKIPFKKTKVKFVADVKNINMYGVSEGALYGKTIRFGIKNNPEDRITNVQLANFNDTFMVKYLGAGKTLLYVKNLAKFTSHKSYKLKFAITTENNYVDADPVKITLKVTNKRVSVGKYDDNKKAFTLDAGDMIYDEESDIYYIINKVEKFTGTVKNAVSDASYKILDGRDHVLVSGVFDAGETWEITNVVFTFAEHTLVLSGKLSDGTEVNETFNLYVMLDEETEQTLDHNDDDGDGLENYLEDYYDCDRNNPDTDGDGIGDYYECMLIGTDPNKADTDGDGLSDYIEVYVTGTDPTLPDTDGNGVLDGEEDADGDGLSNLKELEIGTDLDRPDTDTDGLPDGDEVNNYCTNPCNADSDADGIMDGNEIKLGLNPLNSCTDGVTPDDKRTFNQILDKENTSESLQKDNEAIPSISGNVPDVIGDHVVIEEKNILALSDNRAAVGKQVHIDTDYPAGTDMTITFDCSDESENAEALIICRYDEGRIVPCETGRNNSDLSTSASSGDYFVMDAQKLLIDLDIPIMDYLTPDYIDETRTTDSIGMVNETLEDIGDTDNAVSSEWYKENYSLVDAEGNPIEYANADAALAILGSNDDSGIHYVLSSTLNSGAEDEALSFASDSRVSGQADIVFVIDSTGSMSGAINNVVANVDAFVTALSENYSVKANFALIDYKDITCGEDTVLVKKGKGNWFSDAKSFKERVHSIYVSGGGDGPETPIDALGMAYEKLDFRKNADKFIILITDADYKVNNNYGIKSMDEITDKLAEAKICTSVISETNYENIYHNLYTNTDGVFGNINGNFSQILLLLADRIGDKVNDGTWVLLDDYQYIKLSNDTDDTDEDGKKDYDELGDTVEIDLKPYIMAVLAMHHVPYESYKDAVTITAYHYFSNPTLVDTDYDGINDDKDTRPKNDNTFTGKMHFAMGETNYSPDIEFLMDYSLFFKDNTIYRDELAIMSSVFASDIYSNDVEGKISDTGYTEIDDPKLSTQNDGTALYRHFGMDDVEDIKVDGYSEDPDDVTEIVIGHRKVEYAVNFVKQEQEVIFLTIRGTNGTNAEWSSNFDVGSASEDYTRMTGSHSAWTNPENHKGFDVTANRVIEKFNEYISRHGLGSRDIQKSILITGHSRGAGIANILGAHFERNPDYKSFTYTFASPFTTTASNAESYRTIMNIRNTDDLVTYLPLEDWEFKKYGKMKEISVKDCYERRGLKNTECFKSKKGTFEWLLGVDYNSNGVLDDTMHKFFAIAKNRDELYMLDPSSDGKVNIGNLIHWSKDKAKEREQKVRDELGRYKLAKFCNIYVVGNFPCSVEVNYCPAYLMQNIANLASSKDSSMKGFPMTGYDTRGKYREAKWSFIKSSGFVPVLGDEIIPGVGGHGFHIGGMTHPHLPVTYYLIAYNKVKPL